MLEQFTREQYPTVYGYIPHATYYHKVHTHNHARRGYGILKLRKYDAPIYMRVITQNYVMRATPYYVYGNEHTSALFNLNYTAIVARVTTPKHNEIQKMINATYYKIFCNPTLLEHAYRLYSMFCVECNARYGTETCYCTDCSACFKFGYYSNYDASVAVDYHIEQHRARYDYCDNCGYCSEHCYGYHAMEDYDYE